MAETRQVGTGSGGVGSANISFSGNYSESAGSAGTVTGVVWANSNSPISQYTTTLASGFQNISVPDTAGAFYMELPSGNSQTVVLKGVTGDTGVSVLPAGAVFITLVTGSSRNIGVTAGGTIANVKIKFF